MNKIQNALLNLMKMELNPEDYNNISIDERDWPELYNIITYQGMRSILFPVVNNLPEASRPDPVLYDQWKTQLLFAVISQLQRTQQLKSIVNIFNSVNLPFIVIKGPAIARFYSQPEYRIMSDLDILVEKRYIPLAQQTIESMGYTLVIDEDAHPFHFGYSKLGSLYIEVHYSLVRPGTLDLKKMDDWYGHIWKYKKFISFDGIEFYVMAEEDELINQILHCARHMIHQGARIKHIYDMALIIQHCGKQFDWNYYANEMKHNRFSGFGNLILAICSKFFNISIPDNLLVQTGISPDIFIDRFLNYYSVGEGVNTEYRKTWNKLAIKAPFLCKSLLTLPLVYIIDFIVQLTKNKKTIRYSFETTRNNMDIFKSNMQSLKKLGLSDFYFLLIRDLNH